MTPRCLRFTLVAAPLLALLLLTGPAQAQTESNLIPNPGFEDQDNFWGTFIPTESQNKGCEFNISKDSPHSGNACAELKSTDFARFSIDLKDLSGDPIHTGERGRLTFWIRAAKNTQVKGAPSFIVRILLLDDQGQPLPGDQALFVGLNGQTTIQSPVSGLNLSMFPDPLPTEWTKVESVFEIPPDIKATRLGKPEFFVQYTLGSVFLDDLSLERVGKDVPLSLSSKKP